MLTVVHAGPILQACLEIVLPHPPMPIQLTVMEPKDGLTRANIHVTSWVSPDAEVTGAVDSGHLWCIVLQGGLECADGRVGSDVRSEVCGLQG